MKLHANARLVPKRRLEMAQQVSSGALSRPAAAAAYGVTPKTVAKWTARYEAGGEAALSDRSSRPARLRAPTPPGVRAEIVRLRRERPTGKAIAVIVGVHRSTVSRILRAEGPSRAKDLELKEDDRRYEHDAPGDMIHLDIKKLGRFERPDQWGLATGSLATAPRSPRPEPVARAMAGSTSTSRSTTTPA